jgi:hypothetical protein
MSGRSRAHAKAEPPSRTLSDQQCIRAVGQKRYDARPPEKQKHLLEDFARHGSSSLALAEAKATTQH